MTWQAGMMYTLQKNWLPPECVGVTELDVERSLALGET